MNVNSSVVLSPDLCETIVVLYWEGVVENRRFLFIQSISFFRKFQDDSLLTKSNLKVHI